MDEIAETIAWDATIDAPPTDEVAAVDLGSNSFHMAIARAVEPDLRIVDRLREQVQLASGLSAKKKTLTKDARGRALACLARFGERLRDMPPDRVRAVGTNALRRARDAREFLIDASRALGHPIEIVSGHEEARLVYLGVAHSLPNVAALRLVVDIGGGSTECIIGSGFEPRLEESLHMGCVGYTDRFFPDGILTRDAFRKAEISAQVELQTIERRFRALGWEQCVGASGTILSIAEILRQNGWGDDPEGSISRSGLRKLRKAMTLAGNVSSLSVPGLKAERAPVLAGGLAILMALFESLELERMGVSQGALREGLLYDLVGRFQHEDVRDRTIRRFEERYHVDCEQAARIEETAQSLHRQVAPSWKLKGRTGQALAWAARLHEIGLAVSYSGFHKHGEYLVAHSDMPGFSIDEQRLLAVLVRCHRRRLTRALVPGLLGLGQERLLRLCILLRLAVLLNRGRSPRPLREVAASARKQSIELFFPENWLREQPLTRADLEAEAEILAGVGYDLRVGEKP